MVNRLKKIYGTKTYRTPISAPRALISSPRALANTPDDGKFRVVLDTNVIIYALEARNGSKESIATASESIIRLFEDGIIAIALNENILWEYQNTTQRMISEGKIEKNSCEKLLTLIREKSHKRRSLVTKQNVALSLRDDHLFDSVTADVLISNDTDDVVTEKVISKQKVFKEILTPLVFAKRYKHLYP